MTNYALTLMAVYYLQNTNPVTLPTIQSMADLSCKLTSSDLNFYPVIG